LSPKWKSSYCRCPQGLAGTIAGRYPWYSVSRMKIASPS
jgi:hypothetical protein